MRTHFIFVLLFFTFLNDSNIFAQEERDVNFELILAAYNDDLEEVEKILGLGADVNSKTEEGISPLMYAAQNGNEPMVKVLISYGALVNDKPLDGFTALMSACLFAQLETSITLIEYGANIDEQNVYGATALMLAAAYGYYIITDMLLYYGANTEIRDDDDNTALLIAATHGYWDIVELLLLNNADFSVKDNNGFNALMAASIRNRADVIKTLLSYKPDIDDVSGLNYSALSLAIRNGNDSVAQILVQAGAQTKIENSFGHNSLQVALINKNKKMYKQLLKIEGKRDFKPFFNSIIIAPVGLIFNSGDIMMENAVGLGEVKYNVNFYLGHTSRPRYKKILIHEKDNLYKQYNEKRSFVFWGLSKKFSFSNNFPHETGADVNLRHIYTYGHIKGVDKIVEKKSMIAPGFGIYYLKHNGSGLRLGYEYCDFETYKLSPHKITVSFSAHIGLRKNPRQYKSIYWVY